MHQQMLRKRIEKLNYEYKNLGMENILKSEISLKIIKLKLDLTLSVMVSLDTPKANDFDLFSQVDPQFKKIFSFLYPDSGHIHKKYLLRNANKHLKNLEIMPITQRAPREKC